MRFVISEQCLCFFAALILGFVLGISYEPLRILRSAFKHNAIIVGVEDFFFCLYCTFAIILLCYGYADGIIRWFALCGVLLGLIVYFTTLGILIKKLTNAILRVIHAFLRFLYKKVFVPPLRALKQFLAFLKRKWTISAIRISTRRAKRVDSTAKQRLLHDLRHHLN